MAVPSFPLRLSAPTHLVLPFASSVSPSWQAALLQLDDPGRFPALRAALNRLAVGAGHSGDARSDDEYALSLPHEKVLASHLGWQALPDGTLPWAARQACALGLDAEGERAWGWLTPCHWSVGRETLTLVDPAELALDEAESRQVLEIMRPWFEEEGWALHEAPSHPDDAHLSASPRWLASHPSLLGLPTASLDRVIGRNPDLWMPDHPQARLIKRLQSEMQMLLYVHPFNEAREARQALPVNSFWLSGSGRLPTERSGTATAPEPQVMNDLRTPLLATQAEDWLRAWDTLEAQLWRPVLEALDTGQAVSVTLCGERQSLTLTSPPGHAHPAPPGLAQGLLAGARQWLRRWQPVPKPTPSALLNSL